MKMMKIIHNVKTTVAIGLVALFCIALGRIHLRVETTLTGYQLGSLKNTESQLLEERSQLQMQLAKLTTKKHLSLMAEGITNPNNKKALAKAW